ncbi:DUF4286 family protein [Hydrogenophaga sp. BPS33]|uniref:DUF4286 family protein n=1 Tax=Hydrogenophaga sp. BPS33 TaxID=2651974 RepID=UPI0013202528|nr:DUF4286 family protein [Hydrogenophaga sp. BPS33]QHE84147.1 hypothetical protein F9K07_04210 [Hydrogenophaga sp. BPS33]
MPLLGQATVISWNRVAPAARAEFEQWHTEEHLPERLGIPGFLRGRRYQAIEADRDYLIVYEVRDFDVLQSAAYLTRLNAPTPWTRRVTGTMRDPVRGLCRTVWSVGLSGHSPFVAAVRLPSNVLLDTQQEQAESLLHAEACITALHACSTEPHESARLTVERMHRATEIPQRIALIEGSRLASLRPAGRQLFGNTGTTGVFRLQTALTGSGLPE